MIYTHSQNGVQIVMTLVLSNQNESRPNQNVFVLTENNCSGKDMFLNISPAKSRLSHNVSESTIDLGTMHMQI